MKLLKISNERRQNFRLCPRFIQEAVGCYQPVGNASPQYRPRALKGYASGPSRPVIQNYAVNYREAAVSADLK
uniref:Uncharacterized protein n=1 Tax=Romanomermis culicivorax TaxID=13658 RepID=A0A915JHA0_ROMCU